MSCGDLAVRILEHVGHCALQHADASAATSPRGVKSRGVFAYGIAASSGFYTDQPDLFVCNEGVKQSDRILTASDARNKYPRQFYCCIQTYHALLSLAHTFTCVRHY